MIFDTDILVWVLRRHPGAMQFVERVPLEDRRMSAISYLELLYGCRDRAQLEHLVAHVQTKFAEVLPISETITESARQLMQRFVLSHRPDVSDIIIAATALRIADAVATANLKHFDFIPGLEVRPFRP